MVRRSFEMSAVGESSAWVWLPAAVALLLGIVACGGPEGPGVEAAASVTTTTQATSSSVVVDPDPDSDPVSPPTEFSADQVEDVFAGYAFPPGGPFPIGSIEFMEWLAVCENSFGFEFEVVAEPGQDPYLYGPVPASRDALHSQVRAGCREFVIERGLVFPIEHTAEFGRRVYSGYLAVYDCMLANDFPVNDPPSEETFVSTWMSGGRGWHPYDATPFGGSLSVAPDAGGAEDRVSTQLVIQETCPADWGTLLGGDGAGR